MECPGGCGQVAFLDGGLRAGPYGGDPVDLRLVHALLGEACGFLDVLDFRTHMLARLDDGFASVGPVDVGPCPFSELGRIPLATGDCVDTQIDGVACVSMDAVQLLSWHPRRAALATGPAGMTTFLSEVCNLSRLTTMSVHSAATS